MLVITIGWRRPRLFGKVELIKYASILQYTVDPVRLHGPREWQHYEFKHIICLAKKYNYFLLL